jgi:molybdopterin molybdotransferase
MIVFEQLFGLDFIKNILKIPQASFWAFNSIQAKINSNAPGSPGRAVCLPVALKLENGIYSASPVFGKAGMISILTRADGYIIIDINKEGLQKDETVLVHLF